MSELTNPRTAWTNVYETWPKVGEAVHQASELYLQELSSYLDWAHGVQREVLEQSLLATREIAQFGERQLAFWARLRESFPAPGGLPKGTKTVQGMVQAVVREAGRTA